MADNSSVPDSLQFIGVDDPEAARKFLEERDPCFGKHFDKEAEACKSCMAPVIINGKVRLLREVCEGVCKDEYVGSSFRRLSSRDVREYLKKRYTVKEIFNIMVGDNPDREDAKEARKLLYNRLYYLENTKGFPVPDLPSLEDLLND